MKKKQISFIGKDPGRRKVKDPIRKHKDLKVLQSHVYKSLGGPCLAIQIKDRITGIVYAGQIHKTFQTEKQWKERYSHDK